MGKFIVYFLTLYIQIMGNRVLFCSLYFVFYLTYQRKLISVISACLRIDFCESLNRGNKVFK